jgi:hypothetical protein
MLAAGSGAATARDSTAAISAHVDDYLGPTFGATELYAGPVAKTAILASAVTGDPSSFGGHDLVADLQSLETADGRYADHTAYGDTSNTFTQALGLIALSRTASKPSVNAVNYLLAQQCSDDGFRMFPGDGACVSDPDATSLAVVALAAVGGQDGAQDAAALHLSAAQEPSGGVVGGSGTSGVNANTTGLAAMAWRSAGRTAEADAAADFLRSVQLGCDAPATVRGAVAYDPQTYAALVAAGSHAVASDQERRATAQGPARPRFGRPGNRRDCRRDGGGGRLRGPDGDLDEHVDVEFDDDHNGFDAGGDYHPHGHGDRDADGDLDRDRGSCRGDAHGDRHGDSDRDEQPACHAERVGKLFSGKHFRAGC